MKCVIEIDMDNEAFDDHADRKEPNRSGRQLSGILQGLASDVACDGKFFFQNWCSDGIILRDTNGNRVGQAEFIDD